MAVKWNLWHGCHKLSPGCQHCYVYRSDARHDLDSTVVRKTGSFDLPLRRGRDKRYKIPPGEMVWTCFTSDFLVEDADVWRQQAWEMMRVREDLTFLFITKRIDRLERCLPPDWGEGYPNVQICCTVENQDRADYRLPIFRDAPIKYKAIVCAPILERMDLSAHLGDWVDSLEVGGESGPGARLCRYSWVTELQRQCVERDIPFRFRQTGAYFEKDGRRYHIPRRFQHAQAAKAGINYRIGPGVW